MTGEDRMKAEYEEFKKTSLPTYEDWKDDIISAYCPHERDLPDKCELECDCSKCWEKALKSEVPNTELN